MKSTDRVRYNYYSIDFACVSIEFITKSQCMDGKWIAFGHSEGSSYFYSRGYLKYLMVEYRLRCRCLPQQGGGGAGRVLRQDPSGGGIPFVPCFYYKD